MFRGFAGGPIGIRLCGIDQVRPCGDRMRPVGGRVQTRLPRRIPLVKNVAIPTTMNIVSSTNVAGSKSSQKGNMRVPWDRQCDYDEADDNNQRQDHGVLNGDRAVFVDQKRPHAGQEVLDWSVFRIPIRTRSLDGNSESNVFESNHGIEATSCLDMEAPPGRTRKPTGRFKACDSPPRETRHSVSITEPLTERPRRR